MRLDYILYGLAIVFFIVTAVSFAVVVEQDGKSLWAVSTFVLGILSVSAGYFLKPKVQTTVADVPVGAQEVAPEISTQTAVKIETKVAEMPKIESSVVAETSAVEIPAVVEASQMDPPAEAVMISSTVRPEDPVSLSVTPVVSTAEVSVASPVSSIVSVELTQVKGIGEKRAAQLKTHGVNSVEDLARSDVADLAAKLKVSAKIVEKWIAGAKEIVK